SVNLQNYGFITDLEGGRFFFNAVREGDSILFASDDENECHLWVMAMYRATGQSHKPTPPITPAGKNSTISKIQGAFRPIDTLVVHQCRLRITLVVKCFETLDLLRRSSHPSHACLNIGMIFACRHIEAKLQLSESLVSLEFWTPTPVLSKPFQET
ncbi:unnamed protein product, partial [Timema podura]|nr:unnamed protein product [Timema podura]